jgi:hypothetical protein
MHTQHVKFSVYVTWGGGVGGVVAVVLFFEEGEVIGLMEDDDRSSVFEPVFEVVVGVVFFLPSPSLPLVAFFVVLLDCIDSIRGGDCVLRRSFLIYIGN